MCPASRHRRVPRAVQPRGGVAAFSAAVRLGGQLLDARHHPVFQVYFYGHHLKIDENAREQYRGSPYFDRTAEFCALYDEVSLDAGYASEPMRPSSHGASRPSQGLDAAAVGLEFRAPRPASFQKVEEARFQPFRWLSRTGCEALTKAARSASVRRITSFFDGSSFARISASPPRPADADRWSPPAPGCPPRPACPAASSGSAPPCR